MSKRVEAHGTETCREFYAQRSLEVTLPQLREYLSPGMKVLDVGCGPGSITLDVAAAVDPGAVKGIDLQESSIKQARAAAADRGLHRVEFVVGDGLALPFDAAEFDLTYSHAFFDWVLDPIAALREQVRVTKPGGRVCAMLTNNDTLMLYPAFPSLSRFCRAIRFLADASHPETYHDRFVGRRVVEIFKRSGLDQPELTPMQPRIWYAGQGENLPTSLAGIRGFLTDTTPTGMRCRGRLIELGALSEWEVDRAQREWTEWLQHPYAFHMQVNVFASARVPPSASRGS